MKDMVKEIEEFTSLLAGMTAETLRCSEDAYTALQQATDTLRNAAKTWRRAAAQVASEFISRAIKEMDDGFRKEQHDEI